MLRRSPAEIVLHQHRHHAVVLPELIYYFARFAGSRRRGRHQAERVQNSEVPCVRYLDRSDHEDVRLHQPRHNAPTFGLRGYVDYTLPSHCYAITMILRVRRKFIEITTFPNSGIRARFYA